MPLKFYQPNEKVKKKKGSEKKTMRFTPDKTQSVNYTHALI